MLGVSLPMTDPRRVLGVSPSAPPTEIRRAFRRLVLQLHPDRSGNPSDARLLEVVDAYESLTGKVRAVRRRGPSRSASSRPISRRGRGFTGSPYTESPPAARGRFHCSRCNDTFAIEGECVRCGIQLTDGLAPGGVGQASPPPQPEVDAYIAVLEAREPAPAWLGAVERRVPVATIGTLFAGGSVALGIHAPIAVMMIGYGLALLCADAVLGRAG